MSKAQDKLRKSAAAATQQLVSGANITDQQASSMSEEEIVEEITKSGKTKSGKPQKK